MNGCKQLYTATLAPELSQILFGVKRQFDHSLKKLVGAIAREIMNDKLLGKQPADVPELELPISRGVDEITVSVIDHNEVVFQVVAGPPKLARVFLKSVLRKTAMGI